MDKFLARYRKSVNPPYKPKDFVSLAVTFFILLVLAPFVIITLSVNKDRGVQSNAQSAPTLTANPTTVQAGKTITASWSGLDIVVVPPTPTPFAVNLSVSPSNFNFGDTLTVTWSGLVGGQATDWIGFYTAINPDSGWLSVEYIGSCANSPGAIPGESGTCNLSTSNWGLPNGQLYEVRLLRGDGFFSNNNARLTKSNALTAGANSTPTPTPTPIGIGNTAPQAKIHNAFLAKAYAQSNFANYTIRLYPVGASDGGIESWTYLTCTSTLPVNPSSIGSCEFPIPLNATAGTHELRIYSDTPQAGGSLLLTSNAFTIVNDPPPSGPVGFFVAPDLINPGTTEVPGWSNIPSATSSDWVGFFLPTDPDTSPRLKFYTSYATAFDGYNYCPKTPGNVMRTRGSCITKVPLDFPPGEYELRLFSNDVKLATSVTARDSAGNPTKWTITIQEVKLAVDTSASLSGKTVNVNFSGLANVNNTDLIALYAQGASDANQVAFVYASSCTNVPGSVRQSGSCPFTLPANLAAGTYEFRYIHNYFGRLAVSNPITVTPGIATFPSTGLISYWKLDETSGGTSAFDGIDGNSGTPTQTGVATGKLGKARTFNGSSYITMADATNLKFTGDFTIALWVYRTGPGMLVAKLDNDTTGGGYAVTTGNNGEVYCRTSSGSSYTDSYTNAFGTVGVDRLASNVWTLVAVAKSGSSCRVYINGIDKTNTAGTHSNLISNTLPLRIGARSGSSFPDNFSGTIDEVGIWNRGLSATEIYNLYNGGAGLTYGTTPSPTPTFTPTPTPTRIPTPTPTPGPLTFSNVLATNITGTSASITWTTSGLGTSRLAYGTASNTLSSSTTLDPTLVTQHSVTLPGLAKNKTYYYKVYSKNSAGIEYSSATNSFKTLNK